MRPRHFKIGIDFDDVLVGTADKAAMLYNEKHGTNLTRDNWYDFEPMTPWGTELLSEAVHRVVEIMASDAFVAAVPLNDAKEVLDTLKQRGHELIVLTGRPETVRKMTLRMLNASYPGLFNNDTLYFTNHFGEPGRRIGKGEIAQQLELTHFIDDQIEHVNDVASVGVKALLFSDAYAWNQGGLDSDIVRVNSWKEIDVYFEAEQRG